MSRFNYLLIQLILIAAWAIWSQFEPCPVYIDTTHMQVKGSKEAKVTLIANYDPSTKIGKILKDQIQEIYPVFIESGFVCCYENILEEQPSMIYINGVEKTHQVINSNLSFCLSKELYKEIL